MSEFINPAQILSKLKLRPDMIAADFGCGAGGWAIPLAKILKDGRVYAIDIQKEPLSALEGKVKLLNLQNIVTTNSNVEQIGGSRLSDKSCDFVLMVNLLFQVDEREKVFKEANRVLKMGGILLVVDWLPLAPLGPVEGRVDSKEVKILAQNTGFQLKEESKAGAFHYMLSFEKVRD